MNAELSSPIKRTPLYEEHRKLGARFTEFGGWEMPVSYSGLIDEHQTVRSAAGIFDVSHMGEISVCGPQAFAFLQHIASNDLSKLKPGFAQYSLLLNPNGGVVDDIIIYMLAPENYFLCVNAGNTNKDWSWISEANSFGAKIENLSPAYGQIALQGPLAREILGRCLQLSASMFAPENFPAFSFKMVHHTLDGKKTELLVACTGYTGEDGFEIFCPAAATAALWQALLAAGTPLGLKPAGLGARDTLRLEVCYPLHGHELSDDVSALSSGVGWVIKFDKGEFVGRSALMTERAGGLKHQLVGLEVLDRGIVREGAPVYHDDEKIGWVSSGTMTPTLNKSVALAFVPPQFAKVGTKLTAEVRGKRLAVQVIKKPFYKRSENSK